ncbi:AGE family epimerase/isomerase [Ectobacillus sp. JY-23]|uniref:AGE family epimerase/isomerase n=1 Tax=Ectobacillus sp. JY-23 TaxID=2933872 RepID=UPI001FF3BDBD|nr:AGE family epimerase/isomerase [Ectobacillus sp. JY-23]UOY92244.1 AGE family epimerase/isomerase [Ectobacillus sp. JY-23]
MKEMFDEVAYELEHHILPFWMKLKDEKNGGFYGRVNHELRVDHFADKGGVATARYLWAFSAAYRVTKRDVYLSCARHAYLLLTERLYDQEAGGLYWMLDYKGNVKDATKHVYVQAFGMYALSEYARATGQQEALERAKALFRLVEERAYQAERNAYAEQFTRDWQALPNDKLGGTCSAPITTNTILHVLEAYTNLYRVWPSAELRDKLLLLLRVFHERIYDADSKRMHAFFDENWNSLVDVHSYGHDIEASWLIDDALKELGLRESECGVMVQHIASCIADCAVLADGSLANERVGKDLDTTRVWWVQAEALVGFFNAYERTRDKRFLQLVERLWTYVKVYMSDTRKNGEWHWAVDEQGIAMKLDVSNDWKVLYHNSRCCLELLERLRIGEGAEGNEI